MKDIKTYRTLFSSMFYISAFTFGGGSVIIPLMRKKVVKELGWLSEEEMLDIIAIAQSSPGAVSVNVAAQTGFHIAGIPGMLLAAFATILPKSITTAIGKSLSEEMGGYGAITMATIMLTGQFGAVAAPALLKLFRVTEPLAQGLAIGTQCAFVIGKTEVLNLLVRIIQHRMEMAANIR